MVYIVRMKITDDGSECAYAYNSLEEAPETVRQMLSKAKITPKGAFQLFKATNEQDFFNKYVVKGNSITITSPMTVKPEMAKTGGSYENKAYQIDFGIGYETEVVVNNVPKKEIPPKPEEQKKKMLPKTSAVKITQESNNNVGYTIATLLTMVLGFFGIKRKVK